MKKVVLMLALFSWMGSLFWSGTLAQAQKKGEPQVLLPDLAIGELGLSKNTFAPGEPVEVRVRISHFGKSDLAGIKVRFLLDRKAVGGDQLLSIKANSSGEVRFSFKAEGPGPHELTALVDPDNALKELTKNNNQATRRFEVAVPLASGKQTESIKTGPVPGLGPAAGHGPNPSKESPFPNLQGKPRERQVADTSPRVLDPAQPDNRPPRINGIVLGDGSPETRNRSVILKVFASGNPTLFCYKIAYEGHDEGFRTWQSYQTGTSPMIELYEVQPVQIVSIQVKNDSGVSNVMSARVQLVRMKDFSVDASAVYNRCGNACTRNTRTDAGSRCGLSIEGASVVVRIGYQFAGDLSALLVNPVGSKCEFVFFDGQKLKEGWEYAGATTSFTYKPDFVSAVPQKLGHEILQSPVRGGRDLKFVVRVWADPGLYGEFRMQSLNIKGPWHKPVSEALE